MYYAGYSSVSYAPLAQALPRLGIRELAACKTLGMPRQRTTGTMKRPVKDITKEKLDERFGTAKAIENDDDSSGDSSDEEVADGRRPRYEKDQPAGAILKFVVNKYLDVYGKDNRRVS